MRTYRMGHEPISWNPFHLRLVLASGCAVILGIAALYAFSRSETAAEVVFLGGMAAIFAIVAMVDLYAMASRSKGDKK